MRALVDGQSQDAVAEQRLLRGLAGVGQRLQPVGVEARIGAQRIAAW
jgi:hypothetical protein